MTKKIKRLVPSRRKDEGYALLHDAQGRIDEAIGLIAAISRAFHAAQEREGSAGATDVEDEIASLGIGVKCLRLAYVKLSAAIVAVTP